MKKREKRQNERHAKFLVCISASPSSAKIIEWTAKAAKTAGVKWVALYVETPETLRMSNSGNDLLQKNIALVKALGGEFVQMLGFHVARTVAEYAKQADVTDIVIGKTRTKKTLKNLFEKSLEGQIRSLTENTALHVVSDEVKWGSFHLPKPKIQFFPSDILKSFLVLLLATGLCFLLQALGFGEINLILIYALAIILVSLITTGYAYGLACSVLGILLFDFCFISPKFSFHYLQADYILVFLAMLTVSVVMGMVTSRMKTHSAHAVRREKHLEDLHILSQKLMKVREYDGLLAMLISYFSTRLNLEVRVYRREGDGFLCRTQTDSLPVSEEELSPVTMVFSGGNAVGKFTQTAPELSSAYLPVRVGDGVLAVVGIDCTEVNALGEEERTFLQMALSQFALAIERQLLLDGQKQALVSVEKEKTRSNLLRSVSHDLRTPLTAIYGSAAAIANEELDKDIVKSLAENVCEDSDWLIRMVENLLLVTKISGDGVSLKKQPEAAEEIVAEAVARVKARTQANVRVSVPDELLLVPMDGMLIEQVLINLLDNSVKYAGNSTPIEISLFAQASNAVIRVADNGKGITQKEIDAIERGTTEGAESLSDGKKGMGIGLSLCHTIVQAHGGRITARNKAEGGAEFTIILPMEHTNE